MADAVAQNRQPLPSPQEAAVHGKASVIGSSRKSSSMLSAQTVTTTTVTTTTVTTFPPLRIPKASRKRALAPEKYPLADVPMPPALEHFAMDLNGQRMYFSQRDMNSCLSGRDILASISANTVRSPEPMDHSDDGLPLTNAVDSAGIQRAITPLYTQDDTTTAVRRNMVLATPAGSSSSSIPTSLVTRTPITTSSLRTVSDDRSRRSSSPQSPGAYRHFSRGSYSPSPPARRMHQHGADNDTSAPVSPVVPSEVLGSAENTAAAVAAAAASIATIAGGSEAEHSTGGTPNDADNNMVALDDAPAGGVLPLPSPLLSPRARPEFMDTDDMIEEIAGNISSGSRGDENNGRQKSARRQLRFTTHHHGAGYRGKDISDNGEFSPPMSSRQSGAFDAHDNSRFSVRNANSSHDVAHLFDSRGALGYASNGEDDDDDDDDTTEYASPSSLDYQQQHERLARSKTTSHVVAKQYMPKEMTAMYDMPSIMATYDNLPPSMQTYLLHQLLRRTPRPALQFAAQTVLPVLHRDFIGELPREVSHHVLKFMGTRELCRAACASRRWQDVVNGDRTVWRARLLDARYVEAAPRVHPLCHTYFGLATEEPERSVIAHRPTREELDLSTLGCRKETPLSNVLVVKATSKILLPKDGDIKWREPSPVQSNEFKDEFAHNYMLNRNWQSGKCRHFNFVCDSGTVVTCIQLTEKYIVAGFDTKNIYVFDINTGETVRRLVGHDGGVWALAIIGSTVISGSTDRTVRVWNLETGKCTHVFSGHASTVRCLQILLPTDVRTPQERARNVPVRYEPKEPLIVTGSRDTTLKVWKLPSPTRDEPYLPQNGTLSSSRSHHHASAAQTQTTEEQSQSDGDNGMAVDQGADVASNASDGNSNSSAFRYTPPRGNQYFERTLEGHSDSVRAVAAYGNLVVSGSYDCTIRVWDVSTGTCLHRLEGHTAKVYTIVLDTDMHLIMSGSMDGTIRVWDWDTGVCLRICRGHLTLVGLLSLKHDTLISGGADTTLRIWDHPIKSMQRGNAPVFAQRSFSNIDGDVVPMRRSGLPPPAPASNLFAAQATMTAQQAGNLQQAHLMQQLQVQQRANDQVHHQQLLMLQQQQQQQQQGSGGGPVELSDLVHTERHIMQQHTNAITCFQNDGIKMVSGADSTLKLWDARTGQFVRNLLSNLTSVWQVRFDKRRCVAAVNRNDVTYFEVMDFGA
ncbi:SCF ubiquitin ligase complex subunit cdc4 [Coemansia sp. RSA 1813]|nr:SCF ubiquitin ligase complex subunit cdc4 [Coemansia sp. RSA 1646]KAJ2211727.1 SCF ubiquitin ligase complex subunit cdc4 [Coemansia sp. RSA 487]KAJ2565612.1 SCF ubiquitin ligase complex subunit cdc4 [Coemansia sp. RSA 1813]